MIVVSQGKRLITESLAISIEDIEGKEEKKIMIQEPCGKLYLLGVYATEERAKEIIKEIIDTYKFNRKGAVGQVQAVYEMPKE